MAHLKLLPHYKLSLMTIRNAGLAEIQEHLCNVYVYGDRAITNRCVVLLPLALLLSLPRGYILHSYIYFRLGIIKLLSPYHQPPPPPAPQEKEVKNEVLTESTQCI